MDLETHVVVKRVLKAYRRLGAEGTRILLAVSGGADSLALLVASRAVSQTLGLSLEVASVNHGIRPEASLEVESVRNRCVEWGLRFHPLLLDLKDGLGMEERAREARYRALEQVRCEREFHFIATGHTEDDQAETVLMRLARGAALRGARGILEKTDRWIRPLLEVSRSEVEDLMRATSNDFVQDPHNQEPRFLRVRARQQTLPALEKMAGHAVGRNLARFARLAAEDDAVLQDAAQSAMSRIQDAQGLEAVAFRALWPALQRRVLALWLKQQGLPLSFDTVAFALEAVYSNTEAALPHRRTLRTQGGIIRCCGPDSSAAAAEMRVEVLDNVPSHGAHWLGVEELHLPVSVRTRQAGDRFRLAGGRHRKLQDVLVDRRIPRELRDHVPLVIDAKGDVIWAIGVWPSARSGRFRYYLSARRSGSL